MNKNKLCHTRQSGFTLVELMLSMAFLGFLMLFVVTAVMQLIGTYNKGLVYKEINQSGRTIIEELTRNMRVSSPGSIAAPVDGGGKSTGRLCIAGQTYIWNSPKTNNTYASAAGGGKVQGVVRIDDTTGSLCNSTAPLTKPERDKQVVLARSNVEIHDFSLKRADNGRLITFTVVFSSTGDNAPTPGTNDCPTGRLGEYCAVAEFNEITVSTRR